jgi:hypothetical protein
MDESCVEVSPGRCPCLSWLPMQLPLTINQNPNAKDDEEQFNPVCSQ